MELHLLFLEDNNCEDIMLNPTEPAHQMHEWLISNECSVIKKTGNETWYKCPNSKCGSHDKDENHGAFSINMSNANFNCFHCEIGGTGLEGPRGLLTKLNIESNSTITKNQNNQPKKKKTVYETKDYQDIFEKLPPLNSEAISYLTKRALSEDTIKALDLRLANSYSIFKWNGDLVTFSHIIKGKLAYLSAISPIRGDKCNATGSKLPYITPSTQISNTIVIVEGQIDACSIYQAGYQAIALLGNKMTVPMETIIKDTIANKDVVLFLDSDESGKAGTEKLISKLQKDANIKSLKCAGLLPAMVDKGIKDPNDVLRKTDMGQELLEQLINDACEIEIDKHEQIKLPIAEKKKADSDFPECGWRGLFDVYRQSQVGTTEACDAFHFGVLKTIISIIIGKRCYVYNGRNLYPNFYIVLIGPTKKARKSTARHRGEKLLEDIDESVKILRGLSTPEGLIKVLTVPEQDDENLQLMEEMLGQTDTDTEGFRLLIAIDEFANLLKKAKRETSAGLIQTLTNLYDCPKSLDLPTRNNPLSAINPVVSMICLSTHQWLERYLDIDDIHGGFVNRHTFYLHESTQPIPNPKEPDKDKLDMITNQIASIRKRVNGKHIRFRFDDSAKVILDDWYIKNFNKVYEDEIIEDALQRIDENVRKLALLYAVLENDEEDTFIKAEQLEAAIEVGNYWERSALSIFKDFNLDKQAKNEQVLLQRIMDKPRSKRELRQSTTRQMNGADFLKAFDAILKSGLVEYKKHGKKQVLVSAEK